MYFCKLLVFVFVVLIVNKEEILLLNVLYCHSLVKDALYSLFLSFLDIFPPEINIYVVLPFYLGNVKNINK